MFPFRFSVVFIAVFGALQVAGCGEPQKYPWGRDTKDSFGDGRFQIFRGLPRPDLLLFDAEKQKTIAEHVLDWRRKGDEVYVVTISGEYLVLNYRTAAVSRYDSLDDAPVERKATFASLQQRQKK